MLSLQEMFDKAYIGVVKQGKPSISPSGACKYRGPDDCRCGVGHIIPDDAYDPRIDHLNMSISNIRMETNSFEDLVHVLRNSGVNVDDVDVIYFLDRLQNAHDDASSPSVVREEKGFLTFFRQMMANIAADHNLVVPEVA